MRQLINDLFYSPIRVAVDKEIKRVIATQVSDESLRVNLLYHFHLDEEVKPTLEFSKRLRAYLCYLFAQESCIPLEKVVPLATTMELLHNSTLAVDDIQDKSDSRCGRASLWRKVGIPSALNAAYFLGLYSLQYYQEKRREYGYYDHTALITRFIERLLCGQQKDLDSGEVEKTIENYYAISYGKTGALLNMACLFGCMPYSYDEENSRLITEFSNSLAVCYQILDDFNDIKNGLSLDPSNIYYFVRRSDWSDERVTKEIEFFLRREKLKVASCIQKLHRAGVLKTDRVNAFVNGLLNTGDDGKAE